VSTPSRPTFCLIVGDEGAASLDLAEALEAQGYYVAGPLTSGKDALGWLGRFTPDIAIVDFLRDGAGPDLIQELQSRGIPYVIHTTATLADSLLSRAVVPCLHKPCSIADVLAALATLLC
jgi:DNA-binding response OmpR family regulator